MSAKKQTTLKLEPTHAQESLKTKAGDDLSFLQERTIMRTEDRTEMIDQQSLRQAHAVVGRLTRKHLVKRVLRVTVVCALLGVAVFEAGQFVDLSALREKLRAPGSFFSGLISFGAALAPLPGFSVAQQAEFAKVAALPFAQAGVHLSVAVSGQSGGNATEQQQKQQLVVVSNLPDGVALKLILIGLPGEILSEQRVETTAVVTLARHVAIGKELSLGVGGWYHAVLVEADQQSGEAQKALAFLPQTALDPKNPRPAWVGAEKKVFHQQTVYWGGLSGSEYARQQAILVAKLRQEAQAELTGLQAGLRQFEVSLNEFLAELAKLSGVKKNTGPWLVWIKAHGARPSLTAARPQGREFYGPGFEQLAALESEFRELQTQVDTRIFGAGAAISAKAPSKPTPTPVVSRVARGGVSQRGAGATSFSFASASVKDAWYQESVRALNQRREQLQLFLENASKAFLLNPRFCPSPSSSSSVVTPVSAAPHS